MSETRLRKTKTNTEALERWYSGADVPMSVIRRYAREIADRFQPQKIILFGSYAYGTPHTGSDVDILVIMPARNELAQSWKIDRTLTRNFSVHLIVRTPNNMEWRLREGDWFLREIVARGKVLYEKTDARVGPQGGRRLSGGTPAQGRKPSIS
jgi:predicted nucleotidyltransferase